MPRPPPRPRCVASRYLFMEALHRVRFANPGIADAQCHLAFATERVLPTIHQHTQFVLAPDEWSQFTRCRRRFEPPAHSARLSEIEAEAIDR
jgi:hypothetical protein